MHPPIADRVLTLFEGGLSAQEGGLLGRPAIEARALVGRRRLRLRSR